MTSTKYKMSKKQWCNLCYCYYTNAYIHTDGKRHKKRLCFFTEHARVLSEEMKYNIISFLYPNICNIHSLHKEFHHINMKLCQLEIVKKVFLLNKCNMCFFPKVIYNFEQFEFLLHSGICINCALPYLTSNYFDNLPLYIYNKQIKMCSLEEYEQLHDYYKFNRTIQMIKYLFTMQHRNSVGVNIFDISMLPLFWSLDDFLVFIYNQSYYISNVIELYRSTQI